MPYYRITIWVKDRPKPLTGIREMKEFNIDVVNYNIEREIYRTISEQNLIDYEVCMLPKNCTAVKVYLNNTYRKRTGMKAI